MIKKINLKIVTLFGIGYIKIAPGTAASLVTTVILYLLFTYGFKGIGIYIIYFLIFLFFYSLYAINSLKNHFKKDDPQEIVIDEVIGQSIPIVVLAYQIDMFNPDKVGTPFIWCIFYFLVFRLFDIVKIFPCNIIDKKMKNSLGIMLDDIIAGIYSIIIPLFIYIVGSLFLARLNVWIN